MTGTRLGGREKEYSTVKGNTQGEKRDHLELVEFTWEVRRGLLSDNHEENQKKKHHQSLDNLAASIKEDADESNSHFLKHQDALPEVSIRLESFVEKPILFLDFSVMQLRAVRMHWVPHHKGNPYHPKY